MQIILTGASGMVGQGVLLAYLDDPRIEKIVLVNRRPLGIVHDKIEEVIVPDFTKTEVTMFEPGRFDLCFFGAGVSSVGMDEATYTSATYDTVINFAQALVTTNPQLTFCYVTGQGTDTSENGRLMWARVKGRTENDLIKMGFKSAFCFRPGVMKPYPGQANVRWWFYPFIWLFSLFAPRSVLSLKEIGDAAIKVTEQGYQRPQLEISDLKKLAKT